MCAKFSANGSEHLRIVRLFQKGVLTMRTVPVFLASSTVEFRHERKELSVFVGRLNQAYFPRGIRVELTVCEDLSNAVERGRKQDKYNALIRTSRHFILLVGEEAGDFTLEEFNTALVSYRAGGTPRLHLFCREPLEGRGLTDSVRALLSRLEAERLPCVCFSDMKRVMIVLAEALCQDPLIGGDVNKADGFLVVDGKKVLAI